MRLTRPTESALFWPLAWLILTIAGVALPTAVATSEGTSYGYAVLIVTFTAASLGVIAVRVLLRGISPLALAIYYAREWNVIGAAVLSVDMLLCPVVVIASIVFVALGAAPTQAALVVFATLATASVTNAAYLQGKEQLPKGLRYRSPRLPKAQSLLFQESLVQGWIKNDSNARTQVIRQLLDSDVPLAGALVRHALHVDDDEKTSAAVDNFVEFVEASQTLRTALDPVRIDIDRVLVSSLRPEAAQRWLPRQLSKFGIDDEWRNLQRRTYWHVRLKWLLDKTVAASLLVAFTLVIPVAPLIAFAIRFEQRKTRLPTVYKTIRIGRNGRPFAYYRFRLRIGVNGPETLISQILLVTGLVKFPSLFNVLKDDMSLVGPEPLAFYHYRRLHRLLKHRGEHRGDLLIRLAVKPGFTGPFQVHSLRSGRVVYSEAPTIEANYVRTWTITGDIRLIGARLLVVFTRWRQALFKSERLKIVSRELDHSLSTDHAPA